MKYYFKCPKCGNDDAFHKPIEERDSTGSLLFLFGGIIAALSYYESKNKRIQCSKCFYLFNKPSLPISEASRVIKLLFIIWLLSVAGFIFFACMQDPSHLISKSGFLEMITEIVKEYPEASAIGLFSLTISILVLCVIYPLFSNFSFRKKFKTRYRWEVGALEIRQNIRD